MPPMNEFQPYLERIWASGQLTNNGEIHKEFEKALCEFLGVKHICLFANASLALIIAIKVLDLKGEIITTPFTYVATSQAIYWNNLKPVFVDINETDFNINVEEIERAITPKTSAILPVHIFGNPCNVNKINELAKKYNLKVLYDAAHCFGVEINENSICNFGDLSVLSFHATKVFNTFEGGAIICKDEKTKQKIDALKNSGLDLNQNLLGYGLNAKMNEIQAAFGLVQLNHIDEIIEKRKKASQHYRELLKDINGIRFLNDFENVKHNYSYFPIIINIEIFGKTRDEIFEHLSDLNIVCRKYFYPLVSSYPGFNVFKSNDIRVAEKISKNIICLPLSHNISNSEINFIVDAIRKLK